MKHTHSPVCFDISLPLRPLPKNAIKTFSIVDYCKSKNHLCHLVAILVILEVSEWDLRPHTTGGDLHPLTATGNNWANEKGRIALFHALFQVRLDWRGCRKGLYFAASIYHRLGNRISWVKKDFSLGWVTHLERGVEFTWDWRFHTEFIAGRYSAEFKSWKRVAYHSRIWEFTLS